MGILKTGLKLVGSVTLGTVGVAATLLRGVASAAGSDGAADALGSIQDKSFDKIQDMWTPDEEKNERYYEERAEKSIERAENAARYGESQRRKYEQMKEMRDRENHK